MKTDSNIGLCAALVTEYTCTTGEVGKKCCLEMTELEQEFLTHLLATKIWCHQTKSYTIYFII